MYTIQRFLVDWGEMWNLAMVLSNLWEKSRREKSEWCDQKGRREKIKFDNTIAIIAAAHFLACDWLPMNENGRERKILYCGIGIAELGKRRERDKIELWQWCCQYRREERKKLYGGNGVVEIGERKGKKII